MDVKKAAKDWNVSARWVRDRCKDGMILEAEKKVKWFIPDDAEKPPCTFKRMCKYLHLIRDVSNGLDVNLFPGKNKENCFLIYRYLSDYGYITKLNEQISENSIKKARLTSYGEKTLEKHDIVVFSVKEVEEKIQVGNEKIGGVSHNSKRKA